MRRARLLAVALVLLAGCDGGSPPAAAPTPDRPAGCPDSVPAPADAPWVPSLPTTETPGRLVPDADPVEALVCRYEPGDDGARLVGAVTLTSGLGTVRTDLLLPRTTEAICRPAGPLGVPYLVRLSYADGDLWLSAVHGPGGCSGNGAFTTPVDLGGRVAEAYRTRAWTP